MDQSLSNAASLLDAFRALTAEARRDVCRALATEFKHDECHEMLNLLHKRLYFDVLAQLPIELVAQIASYIEPLETVRLRRVSCRWNEIFSSAAVCSSSFRSFRHGTLITTTKGWETDFLKRTKRAAAQRIDIGFGDGPDLISYLDGMLAWRASDDISMGAYFVALPLHCHLESDFVSCCRVWDYQSGEAKMFRLPSANYKRFEGYIRNGISVDGKTIAVCMAESRSVIVWDFQSSASREIKFEPEPFHIFLDSQQRILNALHWKNVYGKVEILDDFNEGSNLSELIVSTYSIDESGPDRRPYVLCSSPRPCTTFPTSPHVYLDGMQGVILYLYYGEKIATFVFITYSKSLGKPIARLYDRPAFDRFQRLGRGAVLHDHLVYCMNNCEDSCAPDILDYGSDDMFWPSKTAFNQTIIKEGKVYECLSMRNCFGDDIFFGAMCGEGIQSPQKLVADLEEAAAVRSIATNTTVPGLKVYHKREADQGMYELVVEPVPGEPLDKVWEKTDPRVKACYVVNSYLVQLQNLKGSRIHNMNGGPRFFQPNTRRSS
ncbi:predicted protein [Uncinocarpus reesii 1704]|uniref:F-box domain-containing protein n=1 Tax=Uncinocarpus reesii (strain UAMH 1704) TaxID=336963 RepID=C4JGV0_UNCRE|nr:uncharacterized protein UREG_02612 [Uncinocarpus reesii 1704]EEP77763.1 predicted protein [Uncinocarpus reesii 1704]